MRRQFLNSKKKEDYKWNKLLVILWRLQKQSINYNSNFTYPL